MSESKAKSEREDYRAQQEKRQRELIDAKVKQDVKSILQSYEQIKALCPDVNPEAYKAMLFLRKQLRISRNAWKRSQLDPKADRKEKDILLGQYHAVMLAFNIFDDIRNLKKSLPEGKEEEYVREKYYSKEAQQRQANQQRRVT